MPADTPPQTSLQSTSRETTPLQQIIPTKDTRIQPWKFWLGDTVDTGFEEKGVDNALMLKSGVQDNGVAA
jgi:hypothetical protein